MQVVVARGGVCARRLAIHPRMCGSRRSCSRRVTSGYVGGQIDEEVAHRRCCSYVCWKELSAVRKRLDGAREGRRQRMLERRAAPALHEEILG